MLASLFIVDGIRTLVRPESRARAVRPLIGRVTPLIERADPRLPTDPVTLVRVKAAADVLAGLALATGRFTRPSAALLAAGLIPRTAIGDRDRNQVLPNLGLLGGLLLAAVDTQGRPGIRYRTMRAAGRGQRSVRRALRTARREAKIAATSAAVARKLPG